MSNFREMLCKGSRENFQPLKYEQIIYEHIIFSFEAHDLEISNMYLLVYD